LDLLTIGGAVKGQVELPASLFDQKGKKGLVWEAVKCYLANQRQGNASTKTRAEVNRTKKKWYKQKGTGGARHGAKSAPIFVGGGIAHGPRPIKRYLTLPKSIIKKALQMAFAMKIKDGKVLAVSGLEKIAKTKEAKQLIVKTAGQEKAIVVLARTNLAAKRYFKNLKNVMVTNFADLNAYKVLCSGVVILDKNIFVKAAKETKGK
jgi:large subunit ribosomal protein L4